MPGKTILQISTHKKLLNIKQKILYKLENQTQRLILGVIFQKKSRRKEFHSSHLLQVSSYEGNSFQRRVMKKEKEEKTCD